MKTIGLIGGITWLSSLDYYRLLNEKINERLGGVEALKPQHKAERRGNHCQRKGSDQDVIRPRFHSTNSGTTSP